MRIEFIGDINSHGESIKVNNIQFVWGNINNRVVKRHGTKYICQFGYMGKPIAKAVKRAEFLVTTDTLYKKIEMKVIRDRVINLLARDKEYIENFDESFFKGHNDLALFIFVNLSDPVVGSKYDYKPTETDRINARLITDNIKYVMVAQVGLRDDKSLIVSYNKKDKMVELIDKQCGVYRQSLHWCIKHKSDITSEIEELKDYIGLETINGKEIIDVNDMETSPNVKLERKIETFKAKSLLGRNSVDVIEIDGDGGIRKLVDTENEILRVPNIAGVEKISENSITLSDRNNKIVIGDNIKNIEDNFLVLPSSTIYITKLEVEYFGDSPKVQSIILKEIMGILWGRANNISEVVIRFYKIKSLTGLEYINCWNYDDKSLARLEIAESAFEGENIKESDLIKFIGKMQSKDVIMFKLFPTIGANRLGVVRKCGNVRYITRDDWKQRHIESQEIEWVKWVYLKSGVRSERVENLVQQKEKQYNYISSLMAELEEVEEIRGRIPSLMLEKNKSLIDVLKEELDNRCRGVKVSLFLSEMDISMAQERNTLWCKAIIQIHNMDVVNKISLVSRLSGNALNMSCPVWNIELTLPFKRVMKEWRLVLGKKIGFISYDEIYKAHKDGSIIKLNEINSNIGDIEVEVGWK